MFCLKDISFLRWICNSLKIIFLMNLVFSYAYADGEILINKDSSGTSNESLKMSQSYVAGPISSGGGMGVVCYDTKGEVASVELLDLWEARHMYNRKIINSNKTVKEIVYEGLHNLKNSIDASEYYTWVDDENKPTRKGAEALFYTLQWDAERFLSDTNLPQFRRLRGIDLALTNDALEVIRPTSCEIKQLIRYIDNVYGGEVVLNQDLLDKMDNTNLAALYLHEVFYAHLRGHNEQSSIRVRRTIGLIFGGHVFKPWNQYLPKSYYECEGYQDKIYVFMDKNQSGVTFAAANVDGRKVIGFPELAQWAEVNEIEDLFTSELGLSGFGTLGFETGNDFSYYFSLKSDKDGEIFTGFLGLISAPDFINPEGKLPLTCKKVQN